MEKNDNGTILLFYMLFFFGGALLATIIPIWDSGEVQELGSAICSEIKTDRTMIMYDCPGIELQEERGLYLGCMEKEVKASLEFDTYKDGELYCKPKEAEQEISYNGIKVLIKED